MPYNKLINYCLSREFLFNHSIKVKKFLSDKEIEILENYLLGKKLKDGDVRTKGEIESVRKSKVHFFNYVQETKWLFEKINRTIESANEDYYNFDLNGYDSIQYSEYRAEDNGHYGYHIDFMHDSIPQSEYDYMTRKLSFSILLNDDYNGGEFEFLFSEKSLQHKLEKGDMLLFPSFFMHRVAPVTEGVRKSLVSWVTGPKFR
jgi:predicted 2-oxoglutarate/Fe(II)-dependent dioxygenase YbiX